MDSIPFNKVCELEDFADPELSEIIRDAFGHELRLFPPEYPNGVADSKQWEIAMSIRALRHFGALRPDAVILGVGAGTEITSFYLTNHVRQVFATDLYLNPGVWADVAPTQMMTKPESFAPYEFDRQRLVVQHMDGRLLQYPDNTFDGIFSSGSIEHFGSLDLIANAAYEMGRVLKPGGVLTLATEFKISGPPGGDGWDNTTFILSPERLQRYIVEASGLEQIDQLQTAISEQTMRSKRALLTFLTNMGGKFDWRIKVANFPNLILVHEGYVFCSVHLALRKTDAYPITDNGWAQPSNDTVRVVEELNQQVQFKEMSVPVHSAEQPTTIAATQGTAPRPTSFPELLHQWDVVYYRARNSRLAERLPKPFGFLYRTYLRIRYLGKSWDAQNALYRAFADYQATLAQALNNTQLPQDVAGLPQQVAQLREQMAAAAAQAQEAISQVRLLEYRLEIQRSAEEPFDFTASELVDLIRQLEQSIQKLEQANAIDISIQNAAAEHVLAEVSRYFGDRLSAQSPVYRMPNDAWYHFDFTPNWNREALMQNVVYKLVMGGIFVLITDIHSTDVHIPEELEQIDDRVLSTGDKSVRARAFKTK